MCRTTFKLDSSDEQVILYLAGFMPGSLPTNVFDDVNPFQCKPSDLPEGFWYIVHSTEKKESGYGFWKIREEASEVFTNSSMSGWRRILECFELLEGRRIDWVMREYGITQKGKFGDNKEKELRTMCRIFQSTALRSNKEEHPKSKTAGNEGMDDSPTLPFIAPSIDSILGKDSTSGSLMKTAVDSTTLLSEDIEEYMFSDDDFLELDDLANPLSNSSSSDNSSRTSMTYDGFDPNALFQQLEGNGNGNQGQQGKDSSSKCSATASIRPLEVVMPPATSRPLVCATVKQQPSGRNQASSIIATKFVDERSVNHTVKKLKVDQRDEDPLFFPGLVASSSTAIPIPNGKKEAAATPIPNGKKEAAAVKTKRLKKYLCFLPF